MKIRSHLLLLLLVLPYAHGEGATCGAGITHTSIIYETQIVKPPLFTQVNDPDFGACLTRITDSITQGNKAVPIYSQLQAWNADGTKILLETRQILNANDFSIDHNVPVYMGNPRWSPVNPDIIYYSDEAGVVPNTYFRFMSYNIKTKTTKVHRAFPDHKYDTPHRQSTFEELSHDGRYTALMGKKMSTGNYEVFVYDLQNDSVSPAFVVPIGVSPPDLVNMSPSGKYVIVNWAGGGEARYKTVEAFDLNMNFIGRVATGHGHGDLVMDSNSTEWWVDFSPDNSVGVTGPLIKKNRIPRGYDEWKAGDKSAIQVLMDVPWEHSMHISCQGPVGSDWCVGSTYTSPADWANWSRFEQEVFKIYLDSDMQSNPPKPHVERLAHHRTNKDISYFAQPHATVSRDGLKILFGSTWGQTGAPESYLIELGSSGPPDTTSPAAPKQFKMK